MFFSVKLLTSPPIETIVGSPVGHVMNSIESNNALAEPDKRRRAENDKEQRFRGYGGGMEFSAAVGMMIKWKQRWRMSSRQSTYVH